MSNFSGIQKSAKPFKPRSNDPGEVVIARPVGGGYESVTDFQVRKADEPVLETAATPRTDGRGESEIGLSGLVDHPNNDGGAKYLAGKIARVYRKLTADGADLENLSVEQRRSLRDQLIEGIYDGDHQHPSGEAGSKGQEDVLAYVRQVASLLFGLADEIPGTPDFLRSASGDFRKDALALRTVTVTCPRCRTANTKEVNQTVNESGLTCSGCHKFFWADVSLSKGAPANDIPALRKQLSDLTERIRQILATRAGIVSSGSNDRGNRFVTKAAGSDPKQLMKTALENGVAVPFSGADPRTEAEKTGGRRFQTRG